MAFLIGFLSRGAINFLAKKCPYHEGCDGKHCHPRDKGFIFEYSRLNSVKFILKYKNPVLADVIVRLYDEEHFYDFELFSLSFCVCCGSFIGSGSHLTVCFRCQAELEDFEDF